MGSQSRKSGNVLFNIHMLSYSMFYCRTDVRLPQQLQKAMAAEAEATREAKAKIIAAEGELKASKALKQAADVIVESPTALQVFLLCSFGTGSHCFL